MRYDYRTTLRIWTLVHVGLIPVIYIARGRLPLAQVTSFRRPDFSFLRSSAFQFFAASNLVQGLGYFFPVIFLPSYAAALSLSALSSTLLLSLLNLATIFGQIVLGLASDHMDVYTLLFFSSSVSGLSVYLLWGLSKSFVPLLMFTLVYGMAAGGYSVLWSRFSTRVVGEDSEMMMTLFGLFSFGRGVGSILSGPISSVLLGGPESFDRYAIGKYEKMVIFAGATLMVSSAGFGGRFVKK
jgi:MFS family permease